MRLVDTFLKFDAEGFFKDKDLEFLRAYDAYEKEKDPVTGKKVKTDKKMGVWVEMMIAKDRTIYEVIDNKTGEKIEKKAENYGEKFMCLLTDPNRNASDFDKFSIGDAVKIVGYQSEVIMGTYSDILQPRVKDVVAKGDNAQQVPKRSE